MVMDAINSINATNSSILHIPKLRKEELEDTTFLMKRVQKMSKQLSRARRSDRSALMKNIGMLENNLVTARSLVPPSVVHTDPTVRSAMLNLNNARRDLQEFNATHSTSGYLQTIGNCRQNNRLDRISAERSIHNDWKGPISTKRNQHSVWSAQLGGMVDKSLCQTKMVHHQRHWDPTTNTRGLIANTGAMMLKKKGEHNLLHYVQEPVTMMMNQKDREHRKADPLLDVSPSPRHGSEQYVRTLGLKRSKHHELREKNFKYGKLCGDSIHDANVDHPKHGVPFKSQQVVRTVLDRKIEKLEQELHHFPQYGLTASKQKPKGDVEMTLGEMKRVRKETTGAKASALEKKVAAVKKRVKAKLGMMTALANKGFGDFSFLQKIKDEMHSQMGTGNEVRAKKTMKKMFGGK
jgi:hypothetical protein